MKEIIIMRIPLNAFSIIFVLMLVFSCSGLSGERPAPSQTLQDFKAKFESDLPIAPVSASFPLSDIPLKRILIGSCNDEEKKSNSLSAVSREDADLFLMVGDNVYGDVDRGNYQDGSDPELTELRDAFADLAKRPEFREVRSKFPMMVAWDDHDYGINDGGGDFKYREAAELVHERFWRLDNQKAGKRPGTYYSNYFGKSGQRTQVIVLDTRFFRSALTKTDKRGAPGKERYIPSTDSPSDQDMLGAKQWEWLDAELKKPADIRIIVSSIQVLPVVHGWESWNKLPSERLRLFDLLNQNEAENVIIVSGDRHASFIYESKDNLKYPIRELTASSLNLSFFDKTSEMDAAQLGEGYSKENFGSISIDWRNRTYRLEIHANDGTIVRSETFNFGSANL